MPTAIHKSSLQVSLVAPCYNERANLADLCRQSCAALRPHNLSFEIVLVDDGSNDGSEAVLRELEKEIPELRALVCKRRSGQSAALARGLRESRGDVIVTLDSDLQNDPADIPKLLEVLATGYDVVSGRRQERHDNAGRKIASRVANRVRRWVLGDPFSDIGCSLKAYRRQFLADPPVFDGLHRFLPLFALARGARATEIAVNHRPRERGLSKYRAVRGRAMRGILDLFGVAWLLRRLPPR